jgi:hypothetical protein
MDRRSGCGFGTDVVFVIHFLKAAITSSTHSGTPTRHASPTTVGLSNLKTTAFYLKIFHVFVQMILLITCTREKLQAAKMNYVRDWKSNLESRIINETLRHSVMCSP